MLSPAPVSKKISGRSGDSESKSSVASDFEILNIEAVTTDQEEGKTDTNDQEDIDSSASTVTEEDKNPAPAVGGSKAIQDPKTDRVQVKVTPIPTAIVIVKVISVAGALILQVIRLIQIH
jgi:exosome complex RNA-binding protein Csl4